jgi:outer membrane protein assembly factor BamB
LLQQNNGDIIASVFNGINSNIYSYNKSDGQLTFKNNIKGLVHALVELEGIVYYSGCSSIRYKKDGIWGVLGSENHKIISSGFICNIIRQNGKLYGFTQKGILYSLDEKNSTAVYSSSDGFPLYEAITDGSASLLLAGHGKSLIRINLSR